MKFPLWHWGKSIGQDFDDRVEDVRVVYDGEELKRNVEKSLTGLRLQIARLDSIYRSMENRSASYFEKCIDCLASKDEGHARIYADEIAEIRKLAKMVLHSQLVLEQVKIRLETIVELGDVVGMLTPISGVLEEVRGEISGILPEASQHLAELSVNIENLIMASGGQFLQGTSPQLKLDPEAQKIIEDAASIASERVRKSFPEPPQLSEADQIVLEYVRKNHDNFDIEKCQSELKMAPDKLKETLLALQKKGLIEVGELETS